MLGNNKLIIFGIITVFLLSSIIHIGVGADNERNNQDSITVNLNFGLYEIISKDNGQEIIIKDMGHNYIPGKPDLPSKIYSVAIPPGTEITEINFNILDKIAVPERINVLPVPLPDVIGEENPEIVEQNERDYQENYNQVYRSNDPYPENIVEIVRNSAYRKYNLVDIRVTPFTYIPLKEELIYYPEISIEISYGLAQNPQGIIDDNLIRTENTAERVITNYDEAQNWYSTTSSKSGLNDFVIITLDSLTTVINPIVSWENSKGRTVKVVTISWIDTNYNGYDLAEKIRNFLREKYPSGEWGIEDVLMVGHRDDVPMRRCWQDTGYGKPETDFYYAELSLPDNQSWDADGDHRYGESYGDTIDFYAEVNVGRIPWSDPVIVSHICNKSVAYEQNNDPTFKNNMLLLGAFFWSDTDNAVLMEYKTDSSLHPWMSDWNFTKLYEQAESSYPCDYDLNYANVITVWSSGTYGFVNWAGHGSESSVSEYYPYMQSFADTDTCAYLNDDYPAIIFADACSNSDTDYTNIGMKMLEQGGVAFLGATKVAYGYHGWDDPYDGASSSMDYFFTSSVTSTNYTIGQAHQYALYVMYTYGLWYYPKYETFEWGALYGNPNLGIDYYPSSIDYKISDMKTGWNFVSLPFRIPEFSPGFNKNGITVLYNNVEYTWPDAVSAGIVNNYISGWNRDLQNYYFTDLLKPGEGYWMYSSYDCELWANDITKVINYNITELKEKWNIIGTGYNEPLNKDDILVYINDIECTWTEATSNNNPIGSPLINDYVSGWNSTTQSYEFSDVFKPGQAYWVYANENCILYRPDDT